MSFALLSSKSLAGAKGENKARNSLTEDAAESNAGPSKEA